MLEKKVCNEDTGFMGQWAVMNGPRPGRWLAKPIKPRRTFTDLAWLCSFPVYILGYLETRYPSSVPLLLDAVWAIWALATMVICIVLPLRELALRTRRESDLRFADSSPGLEEYAVEIVVRYRNKAIGADRGLVWFDRGLLGFTGERTSFLLAYEDLQPPEGFLITQVDRPFLPLKLRLGKGKVEVAVRPMWGHGRLYRRGLRQFLRDKVVATESRQWPPLVPFDERSVDERGIRSVGERGLTKPINRQDPTEADVNHISAG